MKNLEHHCREEVHPREVREMIFTIIRSTLERTPKMRYYVEETLIFFFLHRATKLNEITSPCLNLHTLSIMLNNGDDLISLFNIVPNIRCLHVSVYNMCTFESPLWSSVVLSHLVEFHLWSEFSPFWQMDELMILLRLMPALQRLLFSIATEDARLLDSEQIRSLLSAVNIFHLHTFDYAVQYFGALLEHSIITNLRQKWHPQAIAFIFHTECSKHFLSLYTIPFKFQRFWTPTFPLETKKFSEEQELLMCYGEGASIILCNSHIPRESSELYSVMQKATHMKKLRLWLPKKIQRDEFGEYSQVFEKIGKEIEVFFGFRIR